MTGATQLPVDVTGEAVSSTVISVKWDHLRACRAGSHLSANNSVLNAIVEYTTVHQIKELFATTSEALLIGLTPFTNYTIKVAAVNERGDVGPYSYPITVQTHEDGNFNMLTLSRSHSLAVPGPVGGIEGTPYVSQVNLTWEPPLMPNGVIVAYEVSYRRTASSQSETRDNTTALVWATENNLEEDTEFIFSLRAYTRVGPGNYSSLTITTLGGDQSSMNRIT